MKNFTFLLFLFITQYSHAQSIGIGSNNTPHPSAALDVNSTTKGFLVPRMTSAQRTAIASPTKGLQVFDTTTNSFWYYNGTAWTDVYGSSLTLPFGSLGNSSNDLFSITNTGTGDAIYGRSNNGIGVSGRSINDKGVQGVSTSGFGVYGSSSSSNGGYFVGSSSNDPALYAINFGSSGAARFNGKVEMNNNLDVDGFITVNNGKGIVRSVNSEQLIMRKQGISLIANISAGGTIDSGYMSFLGNFSAISVIVGNVRNGSTGDYAKVFIMPFDIDLVNDRCRFKITNVGNSSITFDAEWDIILIGQ